MAASGAWQRDILRALGAPATAENIRFFNAWQRAEGGGAAFNPFNTTQGASGASNYNNIGVKSYPSYKAGVQATVQTLLNGRYGNIVSLLRSGKANSIQLANAVAASPWGTGAGVLNVLRGGGVSAVAPMSRMPSTQTEVPNHQSLPAESPHKYSDFAMGLISAMQNNSPEAMLGAIMQLRNAVTKPQPVSTSPLKTPKLPGTTTPGTTGGGGGQPLADLLRAERIAKQMGLHESENYNLPGGVNPVHVKDSYHYRKFPGTNIGEAIDVSGTPQQMMAYAKRMLALGGTAELFYDPFGGYKYGKSIGPIGGHQTHVHVAY
jgi:hypothetical protein